MRKNTALNAIHHDFGARMVDFAGWDMPLHYGSQVAEHQAVRGCAGIFDVSHMSVVDLTGEQAAAFVRRLLANDIDKLSRTGDALYSCMLNHAGGVMDDLIAYRGEAGHVRLVINSATTEQDLAWIKEHADRHQVGVAMRRDLNILAVQGPAARDAVLAQLGADEREPVAALKPFQATDAGALFISRTGYTGEDGFELLLPDDRVTHWWRALTDDGIRPCGLGARDTLRIEAGLNLSGQDMDVHTTPLHCGLAWTVAWQPDDRDFIGRDVLARVAEQRDLPRFAGLLLERRGVLRSGQTVATDHGEGVITSGSFSPTLERAVALARLPASVRPGDNVAVDIRGRRQSARVVKPPFVHHGKVRVDI